MKIIIPILILFLSVVLFGYSEDAVYQSKTAPSGQKAETIEDHSELYLMYGIQISKRFCYLGSPNGCEDGEVIESDTLQTSFLVRVGYSSENPDSVLFDGLEGVNSSPREMISDGFNGGSPAYLRCISLSIDCGHARKNGNKLEFNLSSPGGHYTGTGTLDNDWLTIQGEYSYRGTGAEYILEGHKIVEEK